MISSWRCLPIFQIGAASVVLACLMVRADDEPAVAAKDTESSSTYATDDGLDEVDRYLMGSLGIQHIPGMSIAVIKNGKLIKAQSYGKASIELDVNATTANVYELASTTKPFVAMAILMLRRDGKLQLDDPIEKHLGIPKAWEMITIRHLLTHTSGIKDYLNDVGHNFPHQTSIAEVIERIGREPLSFDPGSKWSYSNTGYILLSAVIEKYAGKPYDQFLREKIFEPLGMLATRRDSVDEVIPNRASLYVWNGWEMRNVEFLKHQMMNHGDRGLTSSVLDLSKFEQVFRPDVIFTNEELQEMWTEVVLNDRSTFGYGLGWFIGNVQGHRLISHAGGAPGSAAMIAHYPEDGLSIIVLANGGATYPQGLQLGIARHYIEDLRLDSRTAGHSELESIEGYYNHFGSQILKAKAVRNGIMLSDGDRLEGLYVPVVGGAFTAFDANRSFEVVKNETNSVKLLELKVRPVEFVGEESRTKAIRIGPLARSLPTTIDNFPDRTRRVLEVLRCMSLGGEELARVSGVSSESRKDFLPGPLPELSGFESATYLGCVEVLPKGIERHRTPVSKAIYLSIKKKSHSQGLLVLLTDDDFVADIDLLNE